MTFPYSIRWYLLLFVVLCVPSLMAHTPSFMIRCDTSYDSSSSMPATISTFDVVSDTSMHRSQHSAFSDSTTGALPSSLFTVSKVHGALCTDSTARTMTITKRDFQTLYYTSLDDILDASTPMYPLSLGYHGQPHSRRSLGGGARDIALMFDGRAMYDVATGIANLNLYSPEDLENIEIHTGTAAVLMSDNASGALINLQEPVHDVKGPYTRLWYADGANNYYASDGTLSQNIAPNTNLTLGFKRQAGDGRFDNQWLDAWNVRGRIRWMPNARTTISLSEMFSNHGTGLNGGIDTAGGADINDEVNATVRLPDYNERVFRHDLTLAASMHLSDSTHSLLQSSLYLSHVDWNLSRGTELFAIGDSSRHVRRRSSQYGLTARWEHDPQADLRLIGGVELEVMTADSTTYNRDMDETRAAAFAMATWRYSPRMALRGGVRGVNRSDRFSTAMGLALDIRLHKDWNLVLDVSQSERTASAVEGTLDPERTLLGFVRLSFLQEDFRSEICFFSRRTRDLLLSNIAFAPDSTLPVRTTTRNIPEQTVEGLNVRCMWSMWGALHGEVIVQGAWTSRGAQSVALLPSAYGVTSIWYQKNIGTSELRAGITTRLRSAYAGEYHVPASGLFIDATVAQEAAFGGIDVFGTARLGNAWIKLRFQNVFTNLFTTVSTFPFPGRNLSLSVAWSFFD